MYNQDIFLRHVILLAAVCVVTVGQQLVKLVLTRRKAIGAFTGKTMNEDCRVQT